MKERDDDRLLGEEVPQRCYESSRWNGEGGKEKSGFLWRKAISKMGIPDWQYGAAR